MSNLEAWLQWMVIVFGITSLFLYSLPSQYGRLIGKDRSANRVQVLVLGDIGRSPRMQYHALSIAKHGGLVDLIGYVESHIHPQILANASLINIHALRPLPECLKTKNRWLFLIYGPVKVLFQVWALWIVLGYRTKAARWMLVQNPPSIPTFFIAATLCFFRHTRLVIDWHNFGYTILALKLGNAHPLVQISRLYERTLAGFADSHFCVSNAMAKVLKHSYHIGNDVRTLHDRPASGFRPLVDVSRQKFLDRLPGLLLPNGQQKLQDLEGLVGDIKVGKSKLLVSSTSWSADEDFSILLDALVKYSDLATTTHPELPELLVVVTGKGPQKAEFTAMIHNLKAAEKLEMVTIETTFLSSEDYANLLGSADLGVSLHTSSSGVDLPMKVVDMFGAGLPVAGWGDFEAWPELVHEDVNGKSFSDARGLLTVLMQILGGDEGLLKRLKQGAMNESSTGWDDEWDKVAQQLFFPRTL